MAGLLESKVALVTGAASGIGKAAAIAFARKGAKVAIVDANAKGAEETAALLNANGGNAIGLACDVRAESQVESMVAQVVRRYGRLDCAFNNAGVGPTRKRLAELTMEEWNGVIAINLTGLWLCMKYELRQMLTQGSGAIVNTSSAAGIVGVPRAGEYAASKHGVVGITKTAALEYAKKGIRANCICPGSTLTAMSEAEFAPEPLRRGLHEAVHPLGRIGTAQEIAEAAVWLCSDEASFVTGLVMPVDGGLTAQ